jgi:hypothetical protein
MNGSKYRSELIIEFLNLLELGFSSSTTSILYFLRLGGIGGITQFRSND